eukprot:11187896-Lingulodinium_polyedra.AAC.1
MVNGSCCVACKLRSLARKRRSERQQLTLWLCNLADALNVAFRPAPQDRRSAIARQQPFLANSLGFVSGGNWLPGHATAL